MIFATLQSSVILLIAFGALHILRRQSAAVRHLILTTALFASILVPFLGPLLPQRAPLPTVKYVVAGFQGKWGLSPLATATALNTMTRVATRGQTPFSLKARDYTGTYNKSEPEHSAAFLIWISGVSAMAVFILAGVLQIAWLVHHARVFIPSQPFELKRKVRLLQSPHAILGTWGVLRPCVLLPEDASSWSDDRLRIVLTHELAHIQRFDWLVQMIAELARAVCWFNPLFWFLCKRLRAESEPACDDIVLNSGINANDYAAHLLELARTVRSSSRAWSPVLAMARPPHLERRFIAMLNPSLNRKPVSRIAVLITCAIALMVTVPLAAVRAGEEIKPVAALSQILPAPVVVSVAKAAEAPVAKVPVKRAAPKPAPLQGLADGSLSGTVSDGTGAVIPGVTVTVSSRVVTQNSLTETDVQTTVTNEVGAYSFPALTPGQYSLRAQLPGFTAYRAVVDVARGQTFVQNVSLSVGNIVERMTVTAPGQPKPKPESLPRRIRVGGNVVAANLISQVKPVYPESARDAGIEGTVHLQALIGVDGTLVGLTQIGGADPDLKNAALDAVKQWRYKPTLLNNEPVQVITTIDVEFKLAQ
jgi:TonB family protein